MGVTAKNVIVIVADSLSGSHTSMLGYERDTTPFIHSYFKEHGLIFTHARSNASWTLPSFNSFLRSRLASEITVSELLGDKGTLPYVLKIAGIDAVGFLKEPTFSILESIYNAFQNQEAHVFPFEDHEIMFTKALAWISKRETDDNPFFLLIHDNTVHNPYVPPKSYRKFFGAEGNEVERGPIGGRMYLQSLCGHDVPQEEKERLRLLYDQKIRYLDDLVQKFISSIPKRIHDETAIIFTADHGDEFGNHHNIFNHGYSLYDELLRVPLCISIPDSTPKIISDEVELLDLAPTVLHLLKVDIPETFCGRVLPYDDEEHKPKIIQAEGNRIIPFNVRGSLAEVDQHNLGQKLLEMPEEIALIKNGWKYYVSRTRGEELYRVKDDPSETVPVQVDAEHPDREVIHELKDAVKKTPIPLRYIRQTPASDGAEMLLQHYRLARFEYRMLVNDMWRDNAFRQKMVILIEKYPHFFPPYLEILEQLEGRRNVAEYNRFLNLTHQRLIPFCNALLRNESFVTQFTFEELFAFKQLFNRLLEKNTIRFFERLRLMRVRELISRSLFVVFPNKPERHLLKIQKNVDVLQFKKELADREHFWYGFMERQRQLYYHKHTQSIMLRIVKEMHEEPLSIDGPHESERTLLAPYFLHTLRFVENFAYEMNCGLGRVALIRLAPQKIAYRHADTEVWLRGRTRYHLVIDVKPGNILFSGNEITEVENGQLLKYENKVMHKSYNLSSTWRTHLVFDMFPLKKQDDTITAHG